ncbi:hypothetical protein GWK08_13915 [Leptobacterium flavescens]|uniref:histidine kinase n=1 Tax=Leptobacterium flavescens TaxID=472055 RepID=A0A6P0UVU8_9FLAO|nr:hypothetical protein [Leptobacterium flavescens]NER14546.1 hypothetical protein [Leptobacterium flavescens]
MKKLLFLSSFLILCTVLSCDKANSPQKLETIHDVITDVQSYFDSANDKSLSKIERLKNIDTALSISKNYSLDSLVLKNLYYKAYLFGIRKQYDSALKYSHQLLNISTKKKDTQYIIQAYSRLSRYQRNKKDYQSAIQSSLELLKHAEFVDDTVNIASALYKLGLNYQSSEQFQSFKYYNSAKHYYELLKDSLYVAKCLQNMANIQKKRGDFYGSEKSTTDALKFLKNIDNNEFIGNLYHTISVSSKELKNYEEALKWNNMAIKTVKDTISINLAIYSNTRALIYIGQERYYLAIDLLQEILKHPKISLLKNLDKKARYLDNLGYAKGKLEIPEGEIEMLEALEIRKKLNDYTGQFASNIHLFKFYLTSNQRTKAIKHAQIAHELSKKINSPEAEKEALGYLIDLKENLILITARYKHLNDSLTFEQRSSVDQFAKIRFETEEKEKEILKLNGDNLELALANEIEGRKSNFISSIGILVLISFIFLYFIITTRHKKEKIKKVYETEAKLAKRLHDELANDVYGVMTRLQHPESDKQEGTEEVLDKLENIYQRTRDISKETNAIETGKYFVPQLKEMLSSYGSEGVTVVINGLEPESWEAIAEHKKMEVYRVLQELMVNMKKHSQASLVVLSFKKEDSKMHIHYVDNGKGITGITIENGNGLQNAENRIRAIKGSITFDTIAEKGFKANIRFSV